jgi:DNA modification methylase
MSIEFTTMPVSAITPSPLNARTHSRKQIGGIARSISNFGFTNAILVDEAGEIIAGHGRLEAAKSLGLAEVPVAKISGLSAAKKRALRLADNKLALNSGWDRSKLQIELAAIETLCIAEKIELPETGFEVAEIDRLNLDLGGSTDPADDYDPHWHERAPVTQVGDLWLLGSHRLLCGDAKEERHLDRLMNGASAACCVLDPPFNVRINDVVGRGRRKHREFSEASGEMTADEFTRFLSTTLGNAARISRDGALNYVFMDWKHLAEITSAGAGVYSALRNLVVWVKSNAGQGSFYRSEHELVFVYQAGTAAPTNNVQLGKFGRNRSNVWRYAGANAFGSDRLKSLEIHPTVKPLKMVADILLDCTRRNEVVADLFAGSGSTLLAAEQVGRRCCVLEIDPLFVDVCIRRWQAYTGKDAVLENNGRTFYEVEGGVVSATT